LTKNTGHEIGGQNTYRLKVKNKDVYNKFHCFVKLLALVKHMKQCGKLFRPIGLLHFTYAGLRSIIRNQRPYDKRPEPRSN